MSLVQVRKFALTVEEIRHEGGPPAARIHWPPTKP